MAALIVLARPANLVIPKPARLMEAGQTGHLVPNFAVGEQKPVLVTTQLRLMAALIAKAMRAKIATLKPVKAIRPSTVAGPLGPVVPLTVVAERKIGHAPIQHRLMVEPIVLAMPPNPAILKLVIVILLLMAAGPLGPAVPLTAEVGRKLGHAPILRRLMAELIALAMPPNPATLKLAEAIRLLTAAGPLGPVVLLTAEVGLRLEHVAILRLLTAV